MVYYGVGQWYGGGLITIINYASYAEPQLTNNFLFLDNTPFTLLDNSQLLLLEAPS